MSSSEVFRQFNNVLGGRLRRPTSASDGARSTRTAASTSNPVVAPATTSAITTAPEPSAETSPALAADGSRDDLSIAPSGITVTVTKPEEEQDVHNDDDEGSGNEERQSWIPAVKKLVQFTDLRNNERVVPIESFTQLRHRRTKKKRAAGGQFKEFSVVVRKVLSVDLRLSDYRLEIQSKSLRSIFRKIAKPFKEIDVDASPILIRYPFRCLFFLRQDLKELLETDAPDAIKEEITHLIGFIENEPGLKETIKEYEATVPKGKFREDLTWTLFRPHDLVYYSRSYVGSSKFRYDGCGFVERVEVGSMQSKAGGFEPTTADVVRVHMVIGHHTGSRFGLVQINETVPAMTTDVREITVENLPVIPLRFLQSADQENIKTKMRKRGVEYIKYSTAEFTMLDYKGPVAVGSEASQKMISEFGKAKGGLNLSWETNQRVVVDKTVQHELASINEGFDGRLISPSARHYLGQADQTETGPDKEESAMTRIAEELHADIGGLPNDPSDQQDSDSRSISSGSITAFRSRDKNVELHDDDFLICHPEMLCFLLRNRLWVGILVSGLGGIKWRADPYVHLQLAEEKKALIRNLVTGFGADVANQQHQDAHGENDDGDNPEDEFDDFIVGKGRGLIFVLHGAPGLGKTLTAESVAESTGRPLYHVSAGELNIDDVNGLEEQLTKIFRLGRRWGAVVLLDEADVLMIRRNSADLKRNAIVAIFLRMIEYYEGMLFLTTNRLADFDPAFFNRVHITIRYGNLGPNERHNIWRQHVQRASKKNRKPSLWNEDAYRLLGSIETNGREIRNSTRTALGFAQSMDQELDITHVVAVIRNNLSEAGMQDLDVIFEELKSVHEQLLRERQAKEEEEEQLLKTVEAGDGEKGKGDMIGAQEAI